jgi:predicted TIM-barrel fold metal-dependent hydrolase
MRSRSTAEPAEKNVLIVSSDGHASAEMRSYRDYLPSSEHPAFDDFCRLYDSEGVHSWERKGLEIRLDPDVLEEWESNVLAHQRYRGLYDSDYRFAEMERQGVAAEVLFPDFGIPFELYSPVIARAKGYRRTPQQVAIGNAAYNRWLVDFCSVAPDRFAGLALITFDDVDSAVKEIRWAKEAGLRGIVLPTFTEEHPIFDDRYDPIWATLVELEMPANTHAAISGITEYAPRLPDNAHRATVIQILQAGIFFHCQQLFHQMIWGGLLERFADLQVVFTEQGSGWVIGDLLKMDYTWEGSFLGRDVREIVPNKPSEYFHRQCHLGSSLFSRAEAEARHAMGVRKITVGMDYPHHEGTWAWGRGHVDYLRATVGAAGVPEDEARLMLGENAVDLWGFDRATLEGVAQRVGPSVAEVLTLPTEDLFPRGDVHKPLAMAFGGT